MKKRRRFPKSTAGRVFLLAGMLAFSTGNIRAQAQTGSIPSLSATVTSLKFFEGLNTEDIPPLAGRGYGIRFDRARTRKMFWELSLSYPAPAPDHQLHHRNFLACADGRGQDRLAASQQFSYPKRLDDVILDQRPAAHQRVESHQAQRGDVSQRRALGCGEVPIGLLRAGRIDRERLVRNGRTTKPVIESEDA
jgi:hypothetical protein